MGCHLQSDPYYIETDGLVRRNSHSTATNNIDQNWHTIAFNLNIRLVPRCAQLMLWIGFRWVKCQKNRYGCKRIQFKQ